MAALREFRGWFGLLSLAMGQVVPSPVAAAAPLPNQARLSWVRAEGAGACPATEVVREGVVKKLGWNPFGEDAPKSFEVVAKRSGRSWQANIYSYDAQKKSAGAREIQSESDDCGELVHAVALALALAIDPEGTLAASPPPAPSTPIAAPPPSPERTPSPPLPPAPARWRATLAGRGLAAFGALPRAAPGAALAATVYGPSRLALSTGASLLPSVHTDSSAPVFGFGLTAAWIDGCFVLFEGMSTAARACAGLRAGVLHAVVYTPVPTDPGDRFWWAAGAGLVAERRVVGPVFVEAGVDAAMPFVRHRFFAENFEPVVFQQSRVIGTGFVGIGVRID
jgi:hypothetical protein